MKRHTLEDENGVLVLSRKRSGSGTLFGIALLAAGSVAALGGAVTLGSAVVGGGFGRALIGFPLVLVGLVFGGVGVTAVFARTAICFDGKNRILTRRFRLPGYSRARQTDVSGFDRILIDEHLRKGRPRYSLVLAGVARLPILTTRRGSDILELGDRLETLLALRIDNQSGLIREDGRSPDMS